MNPEQLRPEPGPALLDLYDTALPQVYGYLLARCGRRALAEDLAAETFLAAVVACRRHPPPAMSTGWLVGIARHKLVDHWRATEREERGLRAVCEPDDSHDPWDEHVDAVVAHQVLDVLTGTHRAALTLRYLDGLPVVECARALGRTVPTRPGLLRRPSIPQARHRGPAHPRPRRVPPRLPRGRPAMTDPLDALRAPLTPVEPDPAFAAALRARIERALLHPTEVPMTVTDTRPITPRLNVLDARAAAEFCVAAFGAVRVGEPTVLADGRVANIEIAVGGSRIMLTDEYPGLLAPVSRGGPSQSLLVAVDDPDAAVERALAAGAVPDLPVTDAPYGRSGSVLDPSGHRWVLARETPTARPGDVVYAALWTPDVTRAARFFGTVLGWETETDHDGRGRRVVGRELGLFTGPSTLFLCYAVPDVDAAVAAVRAAGGTANDPADREYGRLADCVDDQGIPFALHSGGGAPVTTPLYAELRVPDATRARAFYGTVLGWGFTPGYRPGYWNGTVGAERTRPRTGLSGGHGDAQVMPTFAVTDVEAAVAAVRAAGGSAEAPHRERYGLASRCVDDQGMPFVVLR